MLFDLLFLVYFISVMSSKLVHIGACDKILFLKAGYYAVMCN